MIVMKFGGTSVQDAAAMSRAIEAIRLRLSEGPVVVLSAMARVTSGLLEIAAAAPRGEVERVAAVTRDLREIHFEATAGLLKGDLRDQVEQMLEGLFEELSKMSQGLSLLGECTARVQDAVASLGERMSTVILSQALKQAGIPSTLLDSRRLLETDDDFTRAQVVQEVSFRKIREAVLPVVEAGEVPVLQGFIGSTPEGVTTTIGRGGSDFTASLVGAALEADDIQIWTDVPGILTADPRMVPGVFRIKTITFDEASELAYFGAKVLHPSTLLPAVSRNIPVHVCSSSKVEGIGTLISAKAAPGRSPVKSIACKRGITLVNIHSTRMLLAYGFLNRIFELFNRHETVVDVVATSEVGVSVTVDSTDNLEAIRKDLEEFAHVEVEPNMAIVCIVGENLRHTKGIEGRIFGAIEGISVRMISQGASRINLTFVVREEELEEAVLRLHRDLFETPDPEVFDSVDSSQMPVVSGG